MQHPVGQIHDLIAFRILVDTTTDCYIALGHIHSLWRPKEGRIKDFIANPKLNGYSALHTTVFCLENHLVEIQIRTHIMHEMAEYGVAMHWHYKDVGDNASGSAKELHAWLHQLEEWQHDIRSSNTTDTEFIEVVKDDIFQEQIFVFTPKGEVKDLPVGSTPIDFAYRIHTKVGESCAGARVITYLDDEDRLVTRMVPLDYELKSGEVVDIVTSRTAHPTRDWLNVARTAAAKSKIRRYLKTHERTINIPIGRERLERELKVAGLRGLEALTEDVQRWLCEAYQQDNFDELLMLIGADDIRPRSAVVHLLEYWQQRDGNSSKESKEKGNGASLALPTSTGKLAAVTKSNNAQLQVAGVTGLLTKLANCCYPLPDDAIIGFISRGKGVIVHRADCQNIMRLHKNDGERLINVSWSGMSQQHYHALILLIASDRSGLIRDIATVISDFGLNLLSINTPNSNKGRVVITLTVEISDLGQLQRLIARLEKIKDVQKVERDLGIR